MRKMVLNQVFELAKQDERVLFIGSDLGSGTLKEFRQQFPDRFFMEAISEANILGMATGFALDGRIPYVNTIATFLTRRSFEQAVIDVGLHNAPVRMIGNGGGLVYGPLGPTHVATDDIGIFRTIPNMTILAPADAREMRRLMPQTLAHPGPIYIRLAKGGDPVVTPEDGPLAIGRAVPMREGDAALVVTTGTTLQIALEAAKDLAAQGVEVAILHMPTIKPLDETSLLAAAGRTSLVATIEEHSLIGGLGSAVAESLVDHNVLPKRGIVRLGAPDRFVDVYGSQAEIMNKFGINKSNLASRIIERLR
jgi:transketolase